MGRKKVRKTAAISQIPPKRGTGLSFHDCLGKSASVAQHEETFQPSFTKFDFKLPGGLRDSPAKDSGSRKSIRFDSKSIIRAPSPALFPPSSRAQSPEQAAFHFAFPDSLDETEALVSPPSGRTNDLFNPAIWQIRSTNNIIVSQPVDSVDDDATKTSENDGDAMQTAGCEPTEESGRRKVRLSDRVSNNSDDEVAADEVAPPGHECDGVPVQANPTSHQDRRSSITSADQVATGSFTTQLDHSQEYGRRSLRRDPPEDVRARFPPFMDSFVEVDPPDRASSSFPVHHLVSTQKDPPDEQTSNAHIHGYHEADSFRKSGRDSTYNFASKPNADTAFQNEMMSIETIPSFDLDGQDLTIGLVHNNYVKASDFPSVFVEVQQVRAEPDDVNELDEMLKTIHESKVGLDLNLEFSAQDHVIDNRSSNLPLAQGTESSTALIHSAIIAPGKAIRLRPVAQNDYMAVSSKRQPQAADDKQPTLVPADYVDVPANKQDINEPDLPKLDSQYQVRSGMGIAPQKCESLPATFDSGVVAASITASISAEALLWRKKRQDRSRSMTALLKLKQQEAEQLLNMKSDLANSDDDWKVKRSCSEFLETDKLGELVAKPAELVDKQSERALLTFPNKTSRANPTLPAAMDAGNAEEKSHVREHQLSKIPEIGPAAALSEDFLGTDLKTPADDQSKKSREDQAAFQPIDLFGDRVPTMMRTQQRQESLASSDESTTLATFSDTCTRGRGSTSSLSTLDSKRRIRTHSKDLSVDSNDSHDSHAAYLFNRGNGILGLLQHHFETAFYNELRDTSEDDNRDDYDQWVATLKYPKRTWDYAGRIWTRPSDENIHDGSSDHESRFAPPHFSMNNTEGNQNHASQELIEVQPTDNEEDNEKMRVGAQKHEWSDSDTDSDESPRHFLAANTRIRRELHTVAMHVAEQQRQPSESDEKESDDHSLEMDDFFRGEGLTESMIEGIYDGEVRAIHRDKMKQDIKQALVELEMDGLDYDSDEDSNASEVSTLSRAMGATFALFKAHSLFMRVIKKKRTSELLEEDEESFLSISSSEGEHSDGSAVRRQDEALLSERRPLVLSVYFDPIENEDEEEYGLMDDDSFHSLGSLEGLSVALWESDQYDMLASTSDVSPSHMKKVIFADISDVRSQVEHPYGAKSRRGLVRLVSHFLRSKDEAKGDRADRSDKLSSNKGSSGRSLEKTSENGYDDSDGSDWSAVIPDVRWDFTDRRDFFGALQVIWEPPPKQFSDIENPFVPFGDRDEGSMIEIFSEIDESERIITLSIPFLENAYKKIPKRSRPYALFAFFLLFVVLPVSSTLAVVAALSLSNESSPSSTEEPSQAPTSSFVFREWTQVGQSLVGFEENGQQGFSLSLADDGSLLAVGARKTSCVDGPNCGSVHIYQKAILDDVTTWIQVQRFEGGVSGNQLGFSVAFSGNGRRVAVGSIGDDANGRNSGLVQVYEQGEGSWASIAEFRGQEESDLFGTAVSLSRDGRLLAVGAPRHSSNSVHESGKVYFFEDIGFKGFPRWIQSRKVLSGGSARGWFGWSLAISSDGMTIIAGAPGNPNFQVSGYASVYHFDGFDDDWLQVGGSLGHRGDNDRFGYSVSISGSGKRIAIGAYGTQISNATRGAVFAYNYIDHEWHKLGASLVGQANGEGFGHSVALSPEGDHLAVGSPTHELLLTSNSSTNVTSVSGMVKVFQFGVDTWTVSEPILASLGDTYLGFTVDLATSGSLVAVGLPSAGSGAVKIFE